MKLFTFSGIGARFNDVNDGSELVAFARAIIRELGRQTPALSPAYQGRDDPPTDHFVSFINFNALVGNLGGLVTLSGSAELNAEAARLAPIYGQAVIDTLGNDTDPILVLAHSQGTNNFAFTWHWLLTHHRAAFAGRETRAILFDPKVAPARIHTLLGHDTGRAFLRLLFLQSEEDILGLQNVGFGGKFIDNFHAGDHLWVRALDHGTIVSWPALRRTNLTVLTRPEYNVFRHEWEKAAVHAHAGPRRRSANARGQGIRRALARLRLPARQPSQAVLRFLAGQPLQEFASIDRDHFPVSP